MCVPCHCSEYGTVGAGLTGRFYCKCTSASPLRDYLVLLCREGILNKSGFIPIL